MVAEGGIAPPAAVVRDAARKLLLRLWRGLVYPYQLQVLPIHPPSVSPQLEEEASSPGASASRESPKPEASAQPPPPVAIPDSQRSSPFNELEVAGRRHSFLLRLVRRSQTNALEWVVMHPRIERRLAAETPAFPSAPKPS